LISSLVVVAVGCGPDRRAGGGPAGDGECEDHADCPERQLCDHATGEGVCVSGCATDPDSCGDGEYCLVSTSGKRSCVFGEKPAEGEGEGSEGEGEGSEGEGEGSEGEGEGEGSAADCGEIPMTQGLSEPCCRGYGIDACGAGLFCAAFDGRRQATCYADRSRADRTECTADGQCVSGACNLELERCRSTPATLCTAEIGCGPDPAGNRYACDPEDGVCRRVGEGDPGDICEVAADCRTELCQEARCKSELGDPCEEQEDCVAGECVDCDYNNVICQDVRSNRRECLLPCPEDEEEGWGVYRVSCE
jgi:hypothetical protein